jgi:glycosyltransferase involved in cell wall biosynthesis
VAQRPRIDIACFTGNSGLTDYSVSLARALALHATVKLHTAQEIPATFCNMGFEVLTPFRRSRHYPIDILKFARHILSDRPDILLFQAQLKAPLLEAALIQLFRAAGIKVALTIHDVLPHYPKWWSTFEFSHFYKGFDYLICHSSAAQLKVREMGVSTPTLVVPHGVYDIFNLSNPTQTEARQRIGHIQSDDIVVLFFGHLEPRKGLMEFIAAAKRMQKHPKIKFLIAGGNDLAKHHPDDAVVFEQARSLPNVLIHDKRVPFEDVQFYFRASDIVAMPYREGTTSGVLKLALAFGLPVVVSRVGDLPEQMPSHGGELIEPGTDMTQQLIDALIKMAGALPNYQQGMQHAADSAQWPVIAQQYFHFLLPHA